jgi:hypothetical protein
MMYSNGNFGGSGNYQLTNSLINIGNYQILWYNLAMVDCCGNNKSKSSLLMSSAHAAVAWPLLTQLNNK